MSVTIVPGLKYTFIQTVGQAMGELGLSVPSQIIGNADPTVTFLYYIANRVGKELMAAAGRNGGWQVLRKEWTFTTVSSGNITGTFTPGSAVITNVSSTTNIVVGMQVVAYSFVPYPTTVLSKTVNTITMSGTSQNTSTLTGQTFYCGTDSYALPIDMDWTTTQTFWDRNYRWQLLGPLSAQEWQVLKSGISPTGPRRRFRIMGNQFFIDPVPNQTGNVEAYEYITSNWAQDSVGVAWPAFTQDIGYSLLDDDCMVHGIKWRYKQRNGLDYTQEKQDYDDALERALARDAGNRSLPLNATSTGANLLNNSNVPDTGFGA